SGFISDITTAQITGWLESRKVGPKRWNNLRGSLGRLWKFAQQHNAILRKEKTVLDWVPTKKLKATSREIYTPDEMKKLLKACDREMLPHLRARRIRRHPQRRVDRREHGIPRSRMGKAHPLG